MLFIVILEDSNKTHVPSTWRNQWRPKKSLLAYLVKGAKNKNLSSKETFHLIHFFFICVLQLSTFWELRYVSLRHNHRHLSNIDWWMTRTADLVCLICTVNAASKNRRRKSHPWKTSVSSGHITNLKQSIFVFQYLWTQQASKISPLVMGVNYELAPSLCHKY